VKRYLRYGLRSLLIVMTLLCVSCAWLVRVLHRAEEQREAVAWVSKHGGWVKYGWQLGKGPGPSGPRWLRDILGEDCFQTVEKVGIGGKEINDLTPL